MLTAMASEAAIDMQRVHATRKRDRSSSRTRLKDDEDDRSLRYGCGSKRQTSIFPFVFESGREGAFPSGKIMTAQCSL